MFSSPLIKSLTNKKKVLYYRANTIILFFSVSYKFSIIDRSLLISPLLTESLKIYEE